MEEEEEGEEEGEEGEGFGRMFGDFCGAVVLKREARELTKRWGDGGRQKKKICWNCGKNAVCSFHGHQLYGFSGDGQSKRNLDQNKRSGDS
jgi:hypothetical protein